MSFGAPGEDIGSVADAGSVTTLIEQGHTIKHLLTFHQDTARVQDTNEAGDEFGAALAYTEHVRLSVGVPGEDVAGVTNAGAVHNLDGSAGTATSRPSWPRTAIRSPRTSTDPDHCGPTAGSVRC